MLVRREFMDRLAMCMDLLADQKAAQALRLRYGVLDGQQRTLEEVSKAMKPEISIGTAHNLVRPPVRVQSFSPRNLGT